MFGDLKLFAAVPALLLALAGAHANGPCTTTPVEPEVGAAALLGQLTYQSTASYGTTTGGGCCGTVPTPGLAPGPVYTPPPCTGAAQAPGYSPGYAPSYTPGYAPAYGRYSRALAFTPTYTYRRSFDPGFAFAPVAPARAYYAPALAPVVVRRPVVSLDVSPIPVPAGAHGRVRFRGRLKF
jgi:hypothetical protein